MYLFYVFNYFWVVYTNIFPVRYESFLWVMWALSGMPGIPRHSGGKNPLELVCLPHDIF